MASVPAGPAARLSGRLAPRGEEGETVRVCWREGGWGGHDG